MPVKSAIRKATAPITGGSSAPPIEDAASIAPALSADMPMRFMIGMVTGPVVATSATGLPDTVP